MITVYTRVNGQITDAALDAGEKPPKDAVWIDMVNPSEEEKRDIAAALNIDLPSKPQMQAIEASNRLNTQDGAAYMTIDVLVGAETPDPLMDVLLLALTSTCLVTVRYCEPQSIALFAGRIKKQPDLFATPEDGLLAFLDALTDRIADILEMQGRNVDHLSQHVFRRTVKNENCQDKHLQDILLGVGRVGDTMHKIREIISGIVRLNTFLEPLLQPRLNKEQKSKFQALDRDTASLAEHAQFASQEISFLLDATLGQINIEQNNIIKILSIVMVTFTPPTFFASMWGMNFHDMPEYAWDYGYPMAWGVMLLTAILPLLYFRKRGWL